MVYALCLVQRGPAAAQGDQRRLGAVVDVQLLKYHGQAVRHRTLGQIELGRDLAIYQTLRHPGRVLWALDGQREELNAITMAA